MAKNTRPRDRAPQKSQVERAQVSEFHGFASLSFVPLCVTTFGADTCADAPSIALAVACAVGDFLPPADASKRVSQLQARGKCARIAGNGRAQRLWGPHLASRR
jgi:hypothetical protein